MQRDQRLDVLKGIGISLVVLVHTIGYVRANLPNYWFLGWQIETWLHSFIMPFFVTISGYTFYRFYLSDESCNMRRIKRYLGRLLQIYLVFGISMNLIKFIFSSQTVTKVDAGGVFTNMIFPNTTMWYIWFLLIISSAFTLLKYKRLLTFCVNPFFLSLC